VATSRLLFGAHVPPAPYEGLEALRRLEREAGPLDIVHVFQPWAPRPVSDFHDEWLRPVAESGRTVLLTWEPWHLDGGLHQAAYTAARIAAGDHDAHIRTWARALAGLGFEIYLRPLHEMNGNWYPWAAGAPGSRPADVVAAWHHLREIFAAAGADLVRWVWSPLCDDVPGGNRFELCHPGTDAVDVLALDGYNWGAGVPEYGGWRGVGALFDDAYARLTALGPQPMWFAEVGCSPVGGDKAAWVAELLRPGRFPRCAAVVWFEVDKEQDWRLTAPPAAARAVAARSLRR
jgi:glycosyl hydrolase family 26